MGVGGRTTIVWRMAAKSFKSLWKLARNVNPWKTLYFNFHYFDFNTALRLPVLIYNRSVLLKTGGRIVIDGSVRAGMVKFGAYGLGTQDKLYSRTIWEVSGTVVIKGKASFGRGSRISVGRDATLTIGEHFTITGGSEIICQREINFGSECLLSWDILIMDTDFHHVLNEKGEVTNFPRPINIGNHVWIGCRNTILKGVTIGDDNIISANSTITKGVEETKSVIGGHGKYAGVIKRGVAWRA